MTEHISGYNANATQALAGMQAGGMTPEQSLSAVNRLIDQQAFMMSANDIFYASAVLFVLLIGLVWLTKPVRGGGADAAASGAH